MLLSPTPDAPALTPALPSALTALPQPYLLFLGDTTVAGLCQDRVRAARLGAGTLRRRVRVRRSDGHHRPAVPDAGAGAGTRRARAGDRRRQSGRRAFPTRGSRRCSRRSRRGSTSSAACIRDWRRARTARRRRPGSVAGSIDVRQPPAGIPTASGRKRSGKRLLTVGTDCALGKKYTALALARAFTAKASTQRFPRHRPDRHPDRGRGMPDGRGRVRFRRRRRGTADARRRRRSLGRHRRPGLAVPSGLRRRVAGAAARQPARRDRGLPRTRSRSHARPSRFPRARHRRNDRARAAAGPSHQSGDPLRRRQPQHRAPGRDRRAAPARLGEPSGWACAVADPMRGGDAFERLVEACLA